MRRFKNILYVTNNGTNDVSIKRAAKLALSNNAKLTLLDVVDKIPTWAGQRKDRLKWDKIHQADMEARKQRLDKAAEPYREDITIKTTVREGKDFLETIRQVLKNNHDLVMKDTTISTGIMPRVFATEDMQLLRKCPCPVLLTKHDSKGDFTNVMAAIDFDDHNDLDSPSANNSLNTKILDMAISLSSEENSDLDIVHIYQIIGESVLYSGRTGMSDYEIATYIEDARRDYEAAISELLGRAKRRIGDQVYDTVNINVHVLKGNAKIDIPEQAKLRGTDLIVMGTVARTGIPGFFIGNTAETILNNIDCSVLALKPDDFVSPVTLV
ncbi:MAG: universal stress protein [Robiginitomaculum sp.]|nr:universal stress protein [Robiginitomaculum sp.]